MNSEQDKALDDVFKNGLIEPNAPVVFNEGDWEALEQMLNENKKGIIFFILPYITGIAAISMLVLGWWLFSNNTTENNLVDHKINVKNDRIQKYKEPSGDSINSNTNLKYTSTSDGTIQHFPQANPKLMRYQANQRIQRNNLKGLKIRGTYAAETARRDTTGKFSFIPTNELAFEPIILKQPKSIFPNSNIKSGQIANLDLLSIYQINQSQNNLFKDDIKDDHKTINFKPQFGLTVLAGNDLNGVGSFQQSKIGTNVGLLFSAEFFRKIRIGTGVIYSIKPYVTNFENYHIAYKFRTNPQTVTADCKMLDFPIDIDYQFFSNQKNTIYLGSGLTSYLMVHESYTYNYSNSYTSTYTVPKNNSYLFGVLNLTATYQRRVKQNFSISFQPYAKLPLASVGYGQVKLFTAGAALLFNWN